MDENTTMMIQLASMMMQNENAIKQEQTKLSSGAKSTDDNVSTTKELNGKVDTDVHATTQDEKTAAVNISSVTELGMDSKLMAEFARQIVMNAGQVAGFHAGLPAIQPTSQSASSSKKQASDKPATIAQLIQSQNLQKGLTTTARDSSEGQIFVYNSFPDPNLNPQKLPVIKQEPFSVHSVSNTNGFGSGSSRRSTIGPIRNRYGRVLRPGIDNYGRFEAVANPGLIMHAMELLRQKDKKKRGPKEKETFAVFMYCLPDKNSKLPKFSSLDPVERALVDQHQQEGYGYPAQDYINGIPRKTSLCLTFSEEKFHTFMVAIYPALEGRLYDMYRIDKTRRLIRVDITCPRQLKDMKYQGSVIVIPYDSIDERPSPIIHRNFDECYNNNSSSNNNNTTTVSSNGTLSLGNPLALMTKFNVPLTTLELPETGDLKMVVPFYSESLGAGPKKLSNVVHTPIVNGTASNSDVDMETTLLSDHSNNNGIEEASMDTIKILRKASHLRNKLKPAKLLHVKPEELFTDLLDAYRNDKTLEKHKLTICFQVHSPLDDHNSHDDDVEAGSVLVMFWEEAFRKHFSGTQEMIPVIDPGAADDLFKICGRILVHGLILDNYLPLKLSQACLSEMLTAKCSDRLLLTSFYKLMSDSEKEVLERSMEEVRSGAEYFSPLMDHGLKIILGSYGCRRIPSPYELDESMIKIANSCIVHNPYWALKQIHEGIRHSGEELFNGIQEEDLTVLYQVLTPNVPSLLSRVTYLYSNDSNLAAVESVTKSKFEEYVFKLSKPSLYRLLYQWLGFDCMCVTKLFVKFSGTEQLETPIFVPKQAMLCLSSSSTSV